jgi:hypothetical protein
VDRIHECGMENSECGMKKPEGRMQDPWDADFGMRDADTQDTSYTIQDTVSLMA